MPVIYYTEYDPISDSVSDVSRQEHALGRALLFKGLEELFLLPYRAEDEEAVIGYDDNGKPFLIDHAEICFNITHCPGLVACAFDTRPLGIDAEPSGYFPEVLIKRALSDTEKEILLSCESDESLRQECFWRFWTLKEAYVKRTAAGVDTDLRAFCFDFKADKKLVCNEPVLIACSDPEVSCCQVATVSGHIISLCADCIPEASFLNIIKYVDFRCQIDKNNKTAEDPER